MYCFEIIEDATRHNNLKTGWKDAKRAHEEVKQTGEEPYENE